MQRKEFINKYKTLFWYVDKDKLHTISDEVLVEFVLNYGSWESVKELMNTLGKEKVAQLFLTLSKKKRTNLFPEIKHYFSLFFKEHAPQYFK